MCDTCEYTETAKHPGAVGMSKRSKVALLRVIKECTAWTHPFSSSSFLFWSTRFVGPRFDKWIPKPCPDQMSHTMASDLGIIDCFFLSPAFSKKSGGTLFLVFRGAWCMARGAWFRVFSRYFVPLTPPTVFGRFFWNFTGVLRMVWRCACGFFRILKLIFITF